MGVYTIRKPESTAQFFNGFGRQIYGKKISDRTYTSKNMLRAGWPFVIITPIGVALASYQIANAIGANDYAEHFASIARLGLGAESREQAFRRMVLNVFAFNCDDHSKNFAFLMDPTGQWSLAPASEVTFAYDPNRKW